MSLRARIAACLLLVVGLLVGVLAYELSLVSRLERITTEMSRTNVEAARVSIVVLQGLEGVREFASKATALRDEEYGRQWRDWERSVHEALGRLSAIGVSGGEEEVVRERVYAGWQQYLSASAFLWEDPSGLPRVVALLEDLKTRVRELIDFNDRIVAEQAATSVAAAQRARVVGWVAAAAALLLATVAGLLMVHSISGPLRRLTAGTRAVSRGRFDHRLEVDGPTELAQLASDFNQMAAQLAELEDMKRDFVSHVSHELKTPLAAIHETIEVLLDRLAGPLTDKQADLLRLSRASAGRLGGMIAQLLEAARLEAGAATYRPSACDLSGLVGVVLGELRPLALQRRVALTYEGGRGERFLLCDEERIRDVVTNLVGNALKFSPTGGAVTVRIADLDRPPPGAPERVVAALADQPGPFILLAVEDEGPGVPDDEKDRIFEKFHQARGSPHRGQGVGLGLAIARLVAEGHGGTVWVEDREGGGSSFRVILPVRQARWAEVRSPTPRSSPEEAAASAPADRALAPTVMSAVLAVTLATGLAGCGTFSRSGSTTTDVIAAPVEAAPTEATTSEGAGVRVSGLPASASLARGFDALTAQDWRAADEAFGQVLAAEAATDEERAQALWGRAIAALTPESPLFDATAGRGLLDRVVEEFPGTLYQIQAEWMRRTLADLETARRDAHEREVLLARLNEALEAIRQIDLNRTPARAEPAPG